MKPFIIFQETDSSGRITLDKKELERLISEAYEQGKADGSIPLYYPSPSYTPPDLFKMPVITCRDTVRWAYE
jgi:hypothetical protein